MTDVKDSGPAYPGRLTMNQSHIQYQHAMQVVPKKSLPQAGTNLALSETLPIPANARKLTATREERANLRRAGNISKRLPTHAVPFLFQGDELAWSRGSVDSRIATTRSERTGTIAMSSMQYASRPYAGGRVLQTSSRIQALPTMQDHEAVFGFRFGQRRKMEKAKDILPSVRV